MDIETVVRKNFPKTPRSGQIEICVKILEEFLINERKHVLLDAPTGSGKSVIAYCVANSIKELIDPADFPISKFPDWKFKTTIVTSNKNLQRQYTKDFPLTNLWGKTEYPCNHNTHYNSKDCFEHLHKKTCSRDICPYFKARIAFEDSQTRLTNSSFQIEACDLIINKPHNRATLMIIDECHTLSKKIQDHCVIDFKYEDIKPFEKTVDCIDYKVLEQKINQINNFIEKSTDKNITFIEEKEIFDKFAEYTANIRPALILKREAFANNKNYKKAGYFTEAMSVITEYNNMAQNLAFNTRRQMFNEDGKLRAIFPNGFSYFSVFKKADMFLHMSATICNPEEYAKDIGIKDYAYLEMKNTFPVKNRKVICANIQRVSNTPLSDKMLNSIDAIIEKNKGQNGIIHTVSFSRGKQIIEGSKHKGKFFVSNSQSEIMETFKNNKGKVLLSPSAYEGLDFPDDICRFQIIPKVPYTATEDKFDKMIFDYNKPFYFRQTVLKLVQSCGRAIRHEKDFAETYILDSAFYNLWKFSKSTFPKWFLESIQYV